METVRRPKEKSLSKTVRTGRRVETTAPRGRRVLGVLKKTQLDSRRADAGAEGKRRPSFQGSAWTAARTAHFRRWPCHRMALVVRGRGGSLMPAERRKGS